MATMYKLQLTIELVLVMMMIVHGGNSRTDY